MPDEDMEVALSSAVKSVARVWKIKGNQLYKSGKYSDALKYYEKALKVYPNYPDALNNKRLALARIRKEEMARVKAGQKQAPAPKKFQKSRVQVGKEKEGREHVCPECGKDLDQNDYCNSCGYWVYKPRGFFSIFQEAPGYTGKSAFKAALCSAFMPGLGQVYNGEPIKGIIFLIGVVLGSFGLFLLGKGVIAAAGPVLGATILLIPGLFVWMSGIYDAHFTAMRMNLSGAGYRPTDTLALVIFTAIGSIIFTSVILLARG